MILGLRSRLVFFCIHIESRLRDSPPAAGRFSDTFLSAAVRSCPEDFCVIPDSQIRASHSLPASQGICSLMVQENQMPASQSLGFLLHTSKSLYEISPSERFHRDVNSFYAVPLYFTISRALIGTIMPAPFYGGDSVRTYTEYDLPFIHDPIITSFSRLLKGEFIILI